MKIEFEMSTDDNPVRGSIEVRGTRTRIVIGNTVGAFTDASDVEQLSRHLHVAAQEMRHNKSCPDCGGKGYRNSGFGREACETCLSQGVLTCREIEISD